jgi:hypothetical protein
MYKDYNIQDANGSSALELDGSGDGIFTLTDIERLGERTYLQVSFHTDSSQATKATPTSGTVKLFGSADYELIWKEIPVGSFNAADTYLEDTVMPAASGPMANIQVRFDGVTGGSATHARVFLTRY